MHHEGFILLSHTVSSTTTSLTQERTRILDRKKRAPPCQYLSKRKEKKRKEEWIWIQTNVHTHTYTSPFASHQPLLLGIRGRQFYQEGCGNVCLLETTGSLPAPLFNITGWTDWYQNERVTCRRKKSMYSISHLKWNMLL